MEYLIYLFYRAFVAVVGALPLLVVYRLGQALGWMGFYGFGTYRRLAVRNLTIAYGAEKSAAEIFQLARRHFLTLGANLLSSIKAATFSVEQLRQVAEVEGIEHIQGALDQGKGVVLVISHIGNWELFAQLCQFLPQYQWSTVYQPLGNRYIEAHVRRTRTARGVQLFSRKNGFNAPTAFLRAGGAVGVLVDQHAGDGGAWTPFFGRLASTSTLAALLATRTGALLVPMAVQTAGAARWRVVISKAEVDGGRWTVDGRPQGIGNLKFEISKPENQTGKAGEDAEPTKKGEALTKKGETLAEKGEALTAKDAASVGAATVNALTARINLLLEGQIRASPADWFWVHNRWKTPKPKFLLTTYRRGITLPAHMAESELKPFRILIRSTNWLGDAVMTIPAVQAIARGRPDTRVCVLCPAKLADLWSVVPGVAEVLTIEPKRAGVQAVAKLIRSAGPFEAALVLPNSLRSALEMWLAGVPRRVGFAGHRRRWLLNQIVKEPTPIAPMDPAQGDAREHQWRRYAKLAVEVGAEGLAPLADGPSAETVPWGPNSACSRNGWVTIGLCPGAEYGPTKRWFPERFAQAAKIVMGEWATNCVLVGTEKDRALGEMIEKELGAERCENLIGKTSLHELMVTLRRCAVVLTNDTGTMHLAAWLGVPTVAVFGSTDPVLTGPLAPPERVRILRHQVECSPCFLAECPLDLRCMKAVGAEEAAAAVLTMLEKAQR